MKANYLARQTDIIPLSVLGERITIIGAGAIGSFTALQLSKLGFSQITVIDDDSVSEENMNAQFYRTSDIGRPKVEALREMIQAFTDTTIEIEKGRYAGDKTFPGILIVAVDNMSTRQLVFDQIAMKGISTRFVIDPRMGAETAVMHVYSPMDEKQCETYKNTLYSDDDAVQERCTAKSTIYTVNLISGLIAKTVKDIVCEKAYLKSVTWDIASFSLDAWNSEKKNPNRMQATAEIPVTRNLPPRYVPEYGYQPPSSEMFRRITEWTMAPNPSHPHIAGDVIIGRGVPPEDQW